MKKENKVQAVSADLTQFDTATKNVNIVIAALDPFTEIKDKNEQEQALVTMKQAHTISKAIEDKRKELVKPFNDAVKQINNYAKGLTKKVDDKVDIIKIEALRFQKEEDKKILEERTENRRKALESLGMRYSLDFGGMYSYPGFEESRKVPAIYDNTIVGSPDEIFLAALEQIKNAIQSLSKEKENKAVKDLDLLEAFGSDEDVAEAKEAVKEAQAPVDVSYTTTPVNTALKGTTKRWVFKITDESLIPREYLYVNETAIRSAIKDGARQIPGINIYQEESLSLR